MEKKKAPGVFYLTLNLMVQNLLISAFGTCKFILMHEHHPYTKAVRQFGLFTDEQLDQFLAVVKQGTPGQTLQLTFEDELLIYTALDITCKAYLSDLGDELEQLNQAALKDSPAGFTQVRNTLLKGCSYVMEGMKEALGSEEAFTDRMDILDNYILA